MQSNINPPGNCDSCPDGTTSLVPWSVCCICTVIGADVEGWDVTVLLTGTADVGVLPTWQKVYSS